MKIALLKRIYKKQIDATHFVSLGNFEVNVNDSQDTISILGRFKYKKFNINI